MSPKQRVAPGAKRQAVAALTAAVVLAVAPGAARAEEGGWGQEPEADWGDEAQVETEEEFGSELFWATAAGGYSYVNLQTFEANGTDEITADLIGARLHGPAADVALGLRATTFTFGLRGRLLAVAGDSDVGTEDLNLWSLNLEAGFRIPLGRVEPHLVLGAGYSAIGGLGDAIPGLADGLDISGANVRGGLGLTYYVTPAVSIGGQATAEALFLNRRGVPIRDLVEPRSVETVGEARARALEADESSVGMAYAVVIGPGLHF